MMNEYGRNGRPFLFILDFDLKKPLVWTLEEAARHDVWFHFPGFGSMKPCSQGPVDTPPLSGDEPPQVKSLGYSFDSYKDQFEQVVGEIKRGNSFLVNLTCQTSVSVDPSLEVVYRLAKARYKLRVGNLFTCFSPETFVRIQNGKITSFPMKGTLDATQPMARQRLLDDVKEKAEHSTIVDLIRNDLSRVATNVRVERFRYVDELETDKGKLLQVSSAISGDLHSGYASEIGELLVNLLPAGSVTGAPKAKTVQIIQTVETYKRGYYTGVFGLFDGQQLDSAVMIRFFERTPHGVVYKSGGGITALSCLEQEYDEMLRKIYVPVC